MAIRTKKYLLGAVLVAVSLVAAGCSPAGGGGDDASPGGKVTIEFWNPETDETALNVLDEHIAAFEKENPNVTVRLVTIPWSDIYTKWQTAIQSGNAPDATIGSSTFAASFNEQGVLEPLDDVVDALGGEDVWADSAASFVDLNKEDGSYYSLPFVHNSVVLWYNKTMLAEAGLQPPTTWDELRDAAAAMTQGDQYGILVPSSASQVTQQSLYSLILSNGGDIVDRDNPDEVTFDDEKSVEALEFYTELAQYSPPGAGGYDRPEAQAAMTTGRLGMFIYGSWMGGALEQAGPEVFNQFGVVPVPSNGGAGHGAFMGNLSLFMFQDSEHPEETKDFLQFMLEKENYEKWILTNPASFIPVTKDVQESETYLNDERVSLHQPIIEAVKVALPDSWVFGMPNPHAGEFEGLNIISEAASQAILQGVDPQEAAKAAADEMREIIGG